MDETELSPIHSMPTGLCEDASGEAAALIARMADADTSALPELHGLWSAVMLGIAYQILGDRNRAEKVVQDTFVHLWQHAAGYDAHQTPPFVWAFTVMRQLCINRRRTRRNAPTRASHLDANHPPTPPEKPDPLRVLAADDFRRVRTALDQLTLDERNALVAAVFLQYAQPQDPHLATLKNHLRQALKTTRNLLSRYEL